MTFTPYWDKEMKKQRIIEKYLDKVFLIEECVEYFQCSVRTFYRWIKKYKEKWPPWLLHWLKGKPSNHNGETSKYGDIIRIVKQPLYKGFKPTLMSEHLERDFGIEINKETLRQIMIKAQVRTANSRRNMVKRITRERREAYGIMDQLDGSYHDWLEDGTSWCLICAVDDATSKITHAKFTQWEGFEDILEFMLESFEKNGKPMSIYVDCHSTYKVNHPDDQFDKEMKTRFQRWMEALGIITIYAKSPQGKGRVEKWFNTHQDRLIKEMRVKGIKTYEEANRFLERYVPYYNQKFGVEAKEGGDKHMKLTNGEKTNIERYFGKNAERTIKHNGTISYNNKLYQLKRNTILKSRRITVKESIYGNVKLCDWKDCLQFTELKQR